MSRTKTYLASVLMGRVEEVEVTATSEPAALRKIEGFKVPVLAYTGNGGYYGCGDGLEDMRNWAEWLKVLSIEECEE